MDLARDLGNLPGNICTPTYLAERAQALAKELDFSCQVLDRPQLEELKMGSFLSLPTAASKPPKFIVLEYNGAGKKQKPLVLVGKGITFDSGGISIKPAHDMDQMKFDMCGAASVLGTFGRLPSSNPRSIWSASSPHARTCPMAARPSGRHRSQHVGANGRDLNTDAEGRLILCDALTYAERYEPTAVVDIATLTGAMVIALGHIACACSATATAWRGPCSARARKRSTGAGKCRCGRSTTRGSTATSPTSPMSATVRRQHHRRMLSSKFTRKYDWRTSTSRASPGRKARRRAQPGAPCRCSRPGVVAGGRGVSPLRRQSPRTAGCGSRERNSDAIMTSIDFYTHVVDRLEVAARLVAKPLRSMAACAC